MKKLVSVLTLISWLTTTMVGCTGDSPLDNGTDSRQIVENTDQRLERVIVGSAPEALPLLAANLTLPEVAAYMDTLTAAGYSYLPTESIILIVEYLEWRNPLGTSENATGPLGKNSLGPDWQQVVANADTLIWQVFENVAQDSARHTTLMTLYRSGQNRTVFMELDISQPEPQILVAGSIVDGALVQDATATKAALNRLKEALACCAACAVACVLSGPGYAACVAACCAGCFAFGIIMMILDFFWPDKVIGGLGWQGFGR